MTGKGEQMKIFSTVIATMKSFIKEYQPKEITFSAQKEESEDDFLLDTGDTSRSSLYEKLMARLAKEMGFTLHKVNSDYAFKFALVFKE